jgi:AcrR family transcriptional regulator
MRRRKSRRLQLPFPYSAFIRFATESFVTKGYRQTRLQDIVYDTMVAKGSVYTYVQSKEALFFLALYWADHVRSPRPHRRRPVQAPDPETMRKYVLERLEPIGALPKLDTEPPARTLKEARRELGAALYQIYRQFTRNRTSVRLIARCRREHPVLAAMPAKPMGLPAVPKIARFLEIHQENLPKGQHPLLLASITVRALAYFGVYRPYPPLACRASSLMMGAALVDMLVRGTLRPTRRPERLHRPRRIHAIPKPIGGYAD